MMKIRKFVYYKSRFVSNQRQSLPLHWPRNSWLSVWLTLCTPLQVLSIRWGLSARLTRAPSFILTGFLSTVLSLSSWCSGSTSCSGSSRTVLDTQTPNHSESVSWMGLSPTVGLQSSAIWRLLQCSFWPLDPVQLSSSLVWLCLSSNSLFLQESLQPPTTGIRFGMPGGVWFWLWLPSDTERSSPSLSEEESLPFSLVSSVSSSFLWLLLS